MPNLIMVFLFFNTVHTDNFIPKYDITKKIFFIAIDQLLAKSLGYTVRMYEFAQTRRK